MDGMQFVMWAAVGCGFVSSMLGLLSTREARRSIREAHKAKWHADNANRSAEETKRAYAAEVKRLQERSEG